MYIYNVGYGTCEESEFWQLLHEKKFTAKQLNKIIEDCILEVLVQIADPTSEYEHLRSPSFQHIMNDRDRSDKYENRFLKAMEDQGFQKIKFEQEWSVFGWASALDKDDWKGHTDKDQKALTNRIYKQFIKKRPNYENELKMGVANEEQRRREFKRKGKI